MTCPLYLHAYPTAKVYNVTASISLKQVTTGYIIGPLAAKYRVNPFNFTPLIAPPFTIHSSYPTLNPFVKKFVTTGGPTPPRPDKPYYIWQYGDGTQDVTSEIEIPEHRYRKGGIYKVSLFLAHPVTRHIYPAPFEQELSLPYDLWVNFWWAASSSNHLRLIFENHAVNAVSCTWDFGDGTPPLTTNADEVTHLYRSGLEYNVTLTATDSLGKTESKTHKIKLE